MADHQFSLLGFERNPAFDFLFFALVLRANDAARIVQLRERLRREYGLKGPSIAASRLHISLHGVGVYDGLSRAAVEAAKQAAEAVATHSFDITCDRVMSFAGKPDERPLVLRTGSDSAALMTFYGLLGDNMKKVGFRRVASRFTPHMTLLYGDRAVKEQVIEPLQWTADDFVLVHSPRGRGHAQHIHLGRWALRG